MRHSILVLSWFELAVCLLNFKQDSFGNAYPKSMPQIPLLRAPSFDSFTLHDWAVKLYKVFCRVD